LAGKRSGLVSEIFRLIDETKPPFVFLENVAAIRLRGAETVSKELSKRGYDCRWCMLSASDVGALHKRERWFLLGYSKHNGTSTTKIIREKFDEREDGHKTEKKTWEPEGASCIRTLNANTNSERSLTQEYGDKGRKEVVQEREYSQHRANGLCEDDTDTVSIGQPERSWKSIQPSQQKPRGSDIGNLCEENSTAYSSSKGLHKQRKAIGDEQTQPFPCLDLDTEQWQKVVSKICRTSDGVSDYVVKIKCLGNSVVPLQVREAFKMLAGLN